jgi:S1-C subfamily serine protease
VNDVEVAMARRTRTLLALVLLVAAVAAAWAPAARAQIDPGVRDAAVAAAVQVAIDAEWTEGDFSMPLPLPLGSGTVVSPDGLVLTNAHVVDRAGIADQVAAIEAFVQEDAPDVTIVYPEDRFLILVSDGIRPPEPAYQAEVAEADPDLDLAVLRIDARDGGSRLPAGFALPYLPLGDSDGLGLGDPLHIFGYPASGGDALTYTTGVVSGFNFEDGIDGPAWINTDAVISGGSSGGTAVNARGELVGIPTQGSSLDCRPGDTDGDGAVTPEDVGCVPTGGSIGQLRPVNLAKPMLEAAGASEGETPPPDGRTVRIDGEILLQSDRLALDEANGRTTCRGTDGYDDLVGGQDVVIRDGAGADLGSTFLDNGEVLAADGSCRFAFTAILSGRADEYQVVIGPRSPVVYTDDELAGLGFFVSLSLTDPDWTPGGEEPTPTPEPTATPTPTPTAASDFAIDERFDAPIEDWIFVDDVGSGSFDEGVFVLSVSQNQTPNVFTLDGIPSEGRHFAWRLDLLGTSGAGEVLVPIESLDDGSTWFFSVDPVNDTWSLYRLSVLDEYFVWVEPRRLDADVGDPIFIEVQVHDGEPSLLVNTIDVVDRSGVEMPNVGSNVVVGFGVGIDPLGANGWSTSFTARFDALALYELP